MNRDYREKTVEGCIIDGSNPLMIPKKCNVVVRMTSDIIGQSLSLNAYNVMILIPLESVRDIIRVAESEDKE